MRKQTQKLGLRILWLEGVSVCNWQIIVGDTQTQTQLN